MPDLIFLLRYCRSKLDRFQTYSKSRLLINADGFFIISRRDAGDLQTGKSLCRCCNPHMSGLNPLE